jgi:MFS family permease
MDMTSTQSTRPQVREQERPAHRATVATVIGNFLEFFDFTTFALFAVWIGRNFFPAHSPATQLLMAVGTFAAGFLARPLGAVVLGRYADVHGRRAALSLTIFLMAIGTALLAFTPGYATIGMAAPVLVVLARLIQGFSSGGEVGAATSYLIENAPPGARGRRGSWQYASQGLATLTASLIAYALSMALPDQAMAAWGWRVPFLIGLLIAPVGLYIRRHMHEAPRPAGLDGPAPGLRTLFADHGGLLAIGILSISGTAVGAYVIGHYMTSYAIATLHMSDRVGILASVVSGLAVLVGSLAAGRLADRFGRRPVMIWPRLFFLIAVLPAFWILGASPSAPMLVLVVLLLTLPQALSGAALLVALPECFPAGVRSTALSLIYALGASLFGGTAQLVVTWLIQATGNPSAPAWYLLATSVLTLLALLRLHPPHPREPI